MVWSMRRTRGRKPLMRIITNGWTLSALGVAAAAVFGLRAIRH